MDKVLELAFKAGVWSFVFTTSVMVIRWIIDPASYGDTNEVPLAITIFASVMYGYILAAYYHDEGKANDE